MRSSRRAILLAGAAALAGGLIVLALTVGGGGPRRPPAWPTILQDDAQVLYPPTPRVRRTLRTLRALGVTWLRVSANWSFIAPATRPRFDAADPGAYPPGSWARLDRAVREAHSAGLRALIDIAFWAPRWATTGPSRPLDRQRNGIRAGDFAAFATAVARRYSGRYHHLPAAVGFTIWNEPNFRVFLLPQWRRAGAGWEVASADEYRALVYAAVPAVRRQAPHALVLIGATAARGTDDPRTSNDEVPPLKFLRALACVDDQLQPIHTGACAAFHPLPGDGWAHHPYSPRVPPGQSDPGPDTASIADLGRLTGLLARLHAGGRVAKALPVYITEYGYETNPPDPRQPTTLADQARWLPEAEAIAHRTPGVRGFAQFLLRDLSDPADFQSGLEFANGAPKPALQSFADGLAVRRAGEGKAPAAAGEGTAARRAGGGEAARRAGGDREAVALDVFVHLRAGRGRREVRVVAGSAVVGRAKTDANGFATVRLNANPANTFRLEVKKGNWEAVGAPVVGAS